MKTLASSFPFAGKINKIPKKERKKLNEEQTWRKRIEKVEENCDVKFFSQINTGCDFYVYYTYFVCILSKISN